MHPTDRWTVDTLLAHADFVRGLSRTLVSDPEIADDAAQQAWLAACQRPPTDVRSPRGWLATVTANAVRKIRRGEARRVVREQAVATPEGVPSAASIAEREEARRRLVDAVLQLAEPYRSAIVLRYLEELPPREVAARLDVPVETARTRIKRGLEQLRGALDAAWSDRRGGWSAALIALALGGRADAALGGAGALGVVAAVAATVCVAGAIVWSVAGPRDDDGHQAPELATGPVTPSGLPDVGDDGQDPDAPPPLPPLGDPAAGDPGQAPARPAEPAPAAAPAAAAVAAGGTLQLRTAVESPSIPFGGAVVLRATFANTSSAPVKLFRPAHHTRPAFVVWRLVHEDGRVFAPAPFMGQVEVGRGLQGEILDLAPGTEYQEGCRVSHGWPCDADGTPTRGARTEPLPAGRYRVQCTHTQATNALPWLVDSKDGGWGYDRETRPEPGLWTGTLTGPELWIDVAAPTEPRLRLAVEGTPTAGGPCWMRLTIANPGRTDVALDGPLQIALYNKGYDTRIGIVRPALLAAAPAPDAAPDAPAPPTPDRWVVAAGASLVVRFDLSLVAFHRDRPAPGPAMGLYEAGHGGAFVACSWATDATPEATVFQAESTSLGIGDADGNLPEGVICRVLPLGGARVRVELVNGSAGTIRVPRRLRWPHELRVALVDPAHPGDTHVSTTSQGADELPRVDPAEILNTRSWNGSAFEPATPLTTADFVDLGPGDAVGRDVDLAAWVWDGLPAGRYRVTATWRSYVDGRHLGLAPAAAIGRRRSASVEIVVP